MPDILPFALDRVIARRGRLHIYERLDPEATALLVVDMQNAYLQENAPGYVREGTRIVEPINRLARDLRIRGGTVIWLKNTLETDVAKTWPPYAFCRTGELRDQMIAALTDGAEGHALWKGMKIDQQDLVINKYRYSAFVRGASDIEDALIGLGIDTLLIAGLLANTCCESTARDAMMLNYHVVVISDALAAHTQEEKSATLSNIILSFGDVITSEEARTLLENQ